MISNPEQQDCTIQYTFMQIALTTYLGNGSISLRMFDKLQFVAGFRPDASWSDLKLTHYPYLTCSSRFLRTQNQPVVVRSIRQPAIVFMQHHPINVALNS